MTRTAGGTDNMDQDRWQQIDELLDAALEVPQAEREKFLSEKCGGDDDLKNEVLSLLKAQGEADNFMKKSAMDVMGKALADERSDFFDNSLYNKTIGNYRIEKPLGFGGMGEVYLAHDTKLNRKAALKILPKEFVADAERVKRFEIEASAVSALSHPYIVTVYDVGNVDGVNYLATEYVEGKNVRELIGSLSLKETLSIISQTVDALAAAHKAGIIHRDIKPENIMVRPDGYVKVLDFGLAKLTETDPARADLTAQTMKGAVIGTLAYMSPGQVIGDKVDHRADLWSVGVVLYEMLTGKNPFKDKNRQATFNSILSFEPPLPSSLNAEVSDELDRILIKAMEKDADLSYQTASDFRADLKRVRREIDSGTSLGSSGASTQSFKEENTNRNFLLFTFYFLLLILLAFGIWFFAFRRSGVIDWSKATNRQLTDGAGTEFFPALAPDGKTFVYASDAKGNLDIFVQRVGGKNAENLTVDSVASDTQPAFSPDGMRIAFRSERAPPGIYVMESTGENVRRISDNGFHPSWSPDGREIAFSTEGRNQPDVRNQVPSELWIVNVETGAKRLLAADTDAMQPAWSPNGNRVAFWFMPPSSGKRQIGTIAASGGAVSVVTKDDAITNWNPVWSPDGKFLYFASDRGGNMNFWRVSIDENSGEVSSGPEAVVTPSNYSRHLNFSRDGKRLIYVQTNNKSNLQAIEFDAKNEKTVGEPTWITSGDREVLRPELSPDGTQFAMNVVRRTQEDIIIMKRDGSNPRDIKSDAAFDRYPRWSPDSKKIAFISDQTGQYEVYTINTDGTALRQITNNAGNEMSAPIWSPDGALMHIRRNLEPFIIDADKNWSDQTPRPLPTPAETAKTFFHAWDWSPDGKKILGIYNGAETAVVYFSFETNRYEVVFNSANAAAWLSDSRRLVLSHEGKAFIVDSVTKKGHELISQLPDKIINVRISRDDKLLYYIVQTSENDIWLLDTSQNQ